MRDRSKGNLIKSGWSYLQMQLSLLFGVLVVMNLEVVYGFTIFCCIHGPIKNSGLDDEVVG